MELISHAVYLFKQVGFCNKNSFLIFGVFHTKANAINNELIRGDFHYHVIIALESTTANGVGVDEVPKVGVSESSDFSQSDMVCTGKLIRLLQVAER